MTYLTRDGANEKRSELRRLENQRLALVEQKSKWRNEGKLSKNADYHDAKERLVQIEDEIRRIEEILRNAIIIDSQDPSQVNRDQSEVDKVRAELHKLEQVRLRQLNDELRKSSIGKSNPNERSLRNEIYNVQARIKHLENRLDTIITPETALQLRDELRDLVERRRPELAQKLKEAVAQGDLKENADYHDAKEQLGFVEGRVYEIEGILRIAIVEDISGPSDEVRIGSTVLIQEEGEDFDEEYQIVGSVEANPRKRKISEKSPIGSALLGKRIGNKVRVKTPDGVIKFKVVDIR